MNVETCETTLRRIGRRMDELSPALHREEWMGLCRERASVQRQRWALLRSTKADPWVEAWEDGRPPQPRKVPQDPADAPEWADAPTEEAEAIVGALAGQGDHHA